MNQRITDLAGAIEILKVARMKALDGPHAVWLVLHNAEIHLDSQLHALLTGKDEEPRRPSVVEVVPPATEKPATNHWWNMWGGLGRSKTKQSEVKRKEAKYLLTKSRLLP